MSLTSGIDEVNEINEIELFLEDFRLAGLIDQVILNRCQDADVDLDLVLASPESKRIHECFNGKFTANDFEEQICETLFNIVNGVQTRYILVTGASDYLAGHVIKQLIESDVINHKRHLLLMSSVYLPNLPKYVDQITVKTVADYYNLLNMRDPRLFSLDGIFHLDELFLLSRNNNAVERCYEQNFSTTIEMIKLAYVNNCKLMYPSHNLSQVTNKTTEEDIIGVPNWPYFDSKKTAEHYIKQLSKYLHVNYIIYHHQHLIGESINFFGTNQVGFDSNLVNSILNRYFALDCNGYVRFSDVKEVAEFLVCFYLRNNYQSVVFESGFILRYCEFYQLVRKIHDVPPKLFIPNFLMWLCNPLNCIADPVEFEVYNHDNNDNVNDNEINLIDELNDDEYNSVVNLIKNSIETIDAEIQLKEKQD